jgi:SAM-dependent methyltransferase
MQNDGIWEHIQTKRVGMFDRAEGRYLAMAALARRRHGRDGGRVLNIGVGPGRLERLLLDRRWRVACLDPSAKALAARAPAGVDARCGYAQEMPFESGAFDVVIASEVLEHIEPATRERALAEVARVLAPGGWFIGSVPYREVLADQEVICPDCEKVFHRWGHVSTFDLPDMRDELARHFEAVHCRRLTFVDWRSARSALGLLKRAAEWALGRMGESIANPSIEFAARKPAVR